MAKPKTPKSVSKAASVLASDDSSTDAKSLAGSVLATSDDDEKREALAAYNDAASEVLDDNAMVRFQDEAPFSVETSDPEPTEIVGEYSPDLADSETLDEFPVMTAAELEAEGFGTVVDVGPEPEPVADLSEQVAAAQEAAGHVPVTPPSNRD